MSSTSKDTAQASAQNAKNAGLGLVFGLIGVLIFSGSLPGTRLAIESFDPAFLTFARAALAGTAALITLVLLRKKLPRAHLWSLLFVALTLGYGFPGFMALAMLTVPSAHGGVVLGILPLATAIFATLWAGERPSLVFWLCGILGAIIIIVFALRDGEWGFDIGDLWLLIAGLTAAAGYVVSAKLSHHMPGWEVISWAVVLALPISLFGSIVLWQAAYLEAPAPQLWAFIYVGLGPMYLGFFAWNTGLKLGGVAKIGQLQLLQTFFTVGIAALVLGEDVTLETFGFAFAILVVILIGRKAQVAR